MVATGLVLGLKEEIPLLLPLGRRTLVTVRDFSLPLTLTLAQVLLLVRRPGLILGLKLVLPTDDVLALARPTVGEKAVLRELLLLQGL